MTSEEDPLEGAVRIAELSSLDDSGHQWASRSLRDLLELTDDAGMRPPLTEADLAARLETRPELVERRVQWSEDKRTSGGYYLVRRDDRDWRVGSLPSGSERPFDRGARACAAFILNELDVWSQPAGERPR